MTAAIAIFVKTPSLSPVKTRLAAGIGKDKALEFYSLSLAAILQTIKTVDIKPYWAVAEQDGIHNPLWHDFPRLHTGEGCLGARQHHIYEYLLKTNRIVLLIGADLPQISRDIINHAITALNDYDFVIGDAHDGGYYLFGGRKSLPSEVWASVPWSTNTTRQSLLNALPSEAFHLPPLTDVDTIDDLNSMAKEMPQNISTEQKNLIDWVTSLNIDTNT